MNLDPVVKGAARPTSVRSGRDRTVAAVVLLAVGLAWLYLLFRWIATDVPLRETRLGPIAGFLDKLPHAVADPVFLFLWLLLLLGWIAPVLAGTWLLLRRKRSN